MSDIDLKYEALGGPGGPLGAPETAEATTPDGRGRYRHFIGASIYWTAGTGANELHGSIREKYAELGWEQGVLGYPTTDELTTPDGVGRSNHFEGGSIYWTPVTGAHECHGAIRDLWADQGWEQGPVGYPVTDELATNDGWRWQGFQRGAVRWHPDEGARRGSPPSALWGLADLHAHPMAHLGFGGRLVWGQPSGPLEHALPRCDPSHGLLGIDPVASGIEVSAGHLTGGWPEFDGWPSFATRLHQQMHIEWVRRAYDGGLRVLCALVNNSELLGSISSVHGHPIGDREVTDLALRAMVDLVQTQPWMGVARTAADARRIIAEDRMAVVLGLEVDSFAGWGSDGECTSEQVRAELVRLRDSFGVAMITPIHLADNAFGGASLYDDFFAMNSRMLRGRWQNIKDALGATAFRLFKNPTWPLPVPIPIGVPGRPPVLVGQLLAEANALAAATRGFRGHVNGLGLTPRGRDMLEAMMDLGMLIDIDHMSDRATDEALSLAESRRYPMVSSHATFRDLAFDEAEAAGRPAFEHALKHESAKTHRSLQRIRALKGIVACQLNQGMVRDFDVSRVANDCAGSSKSWAQAYLYALHHMGGRNVAIGTDFNGFARACCPRFGSKAAVGLKGEVGRREQVDRQADGVRYAGPLQDYRTPRWDFDDTYTIQERDVWEAVAIALSGADLGHLELRPLPLRWPGTNSWITDVAKGLRASTLDSIPEPTIWHINLEGQYNWATVQRGAFLAGKAGFDLASIADQGIREVAQRVRPVLERFAAMQGPNPPLQRSVAGRRDFDVNVDGVAHYGLIPDFIQDINNAGLGWDLLTPLFRSAEDFVRVWERCEQPQIVINVPIDPSIVQQVPAAPPLEIDDSVVLPDPSLVQRVAEKD